MRTKLLSALVNVAALWRELGRIATESASQNDGEALGHSVAAMAALLRQADANELAIEEVHVAAIYQLAKQHPDDEVQVHCIHMCSLFSQESVPWLLAEMCVLFVEKLSSTSCPVLTEALNAVYDNFDTHAAYFKQINIVGILRMIQPNIATLVQNSRGVISDFEWNRLDEARINLARFIRYAAK